MRLIPRLASRLRASSLRSEQGSLMVETAVTLLIVFPMVFWIFELCMLVYTYSVLGDAARQGVRYAVVHGTDSTSCSGPSSGCGDSSGTNIVSYVKTAAASSFHNLSAIKITVSYPDSSSAPGSRVLINIQYTYVPYITLPGIGQTVTQIAEGRIVY